MARWPIGLLVVAGCDYVWHLEKFEDHDAAAPSDARLDSKTPEPITLVQVAQKANTASMTATLTATLPSPMSLGDLVVVIVGWTGSQSVLSIDDAAGNVYLRAAPDSMAGIIAQTIYYAQNVNTGADAVTVSFSDLTTAPDLRVLEYRGIAQGSAFDAASTVIGTGTLAMVNLATASDNELLVAGESVGDVAGAGPGYALQIYVNQTGNIAEDKLAPSAGVYTVTATQTSINSYVLQATAFRGQ